MLLKGKNSHWNRNTDMILATSQWYEKKQGGGTASDEKIFKIHNN